MLFIAYLLPNGLHEKVMICSICYRCTVCQENPFGKIQQMKQKGYDQN